MYMDNYRWMNALIKKQIKTSQKKGKSQRLVDILDEMNLKEDTTNTMVVGKLNKLAQRIFKINKHSDDLIFVNSLLEEIIEGKKIVRLELERCNRLWKQY